MPLFSDVLRTLTNVLPTTAAEPSTIFRDSRTAARMWGMKDANLDRLPRPKFLFTVNFNRPIGQGGVTRYGDWTTGVSFLIKSATRPNIAFKTETLNQYNKKRVIQTGIEYEPIEVTFYDTYDQRVVQMFKEYCQYYYGDFFGTRTSWNYDVIASRFQTAQGDLDFGFNAPNTNGNNAYFFSDIEFYQFGAGRFNKFTLINPKIQSFNYDDEDYSDNTSPQMIRIRFAYEGIIFEADNQPINQSLASDYGLDLGDFNDVFFPGFVQNPTLNTTLKTQAQGQHITNNTVNAFADTRQPVYSVSQENNNPSYTNAIGNGIQVAFSNNPELRGNIELNNAVSNINLGVNTIQTLERSSATGMPGKIAGNVVRGIGQNIQNRLISRINGIFR